MTIFFIADPLFGDSAAAKRRGFPSADSAKSMMIMRWNATVQSHGDIVYVVGGFSVENPRQVRDTLGQLRGRIYLLANNPEDRLKNGVQARFIYRLGLVAHLRMGYMTTIFPGPAPYKYGGIVHNNPNHLTNEQRQKIIQNLRDNNKSPDMKEVLIHGGIPGMNGTDYNGYSLTKNDGYAVNVSCDNMAFSQTPVMQRTIEDYCEYMRLNAKQIKRMSA